MGRWIDIIYKDQPTADKWNPIIDQWRQMYLGHEVVQTVDKLTVLDFDKLYLECKKMGAEDVPCGKSGDSIAVGGSMNEIQKILFQSSDGNLNFIASCKCGKMKGNYNRGQVCPHCGTEVRTAFADEINIRAWLTIPESLPPFLHPVAFRVLDKWIGSVKKKKASILESIMDVDSDLPEPYQSTFGRGGMWYLYENFDDIIRFIASQRKGIRAIDNETIFKFIDTYRDRLFCRHIPILNQSLHILTHSGSLTYNDDSSKYILKTCIELDETINKLRQNPGMNKRFLDQHVFSIYSAWNEYTDSIIKDKIQGKTGFIRKCNLGARLHFSARGVIAPITHTHWADEIELPWRMVVGLYKLEIINKLIAVYGLDTNMAQDYWVQALVGMRSDEPDDLVRQDVLKKINMVKICIDQLLAECPFKGFPVTLGRNP